MNFIIRKITPGSSVSTMAGSEAAVASLYNPRGVAVDLAGFVYVTDPSAIKII